MNTLSKWVAVVGLLSGAAYGQVPSSNDTSDAFGNTGMGTGAVNPGTSGSDNTAAGFDALYSTTTGSNNTASGYEALYANTTGYANSALGDGALRSNTTGNANTAAGLEALFSNTIGHYNTAAGTSALYFNTTGYDNTAFGYQALVNNTTGGNNTAIGFWALYSNTSGANNTASGRNALYHSTGSSNIALGYNAGYNVTTGNNNIEIGNQGAAGDNGVIRIGAPSTQKVVLIAGIVNSPITGSAVYVNANGRLGVLASSERYKTAIAPIGSDTTKLQELRPVKFHLKAEPHGAVQYGLIAEEVAKVYPELVIRDRNGRIDGVRYDELAPMLLNEMQQQQRINTAQAAEFRAMKEQLAELKRMNESMSAALLKLQPKDQLVAQR